MTPEREAFWRFVYERQSIWFKRHVLELPAPWTDDPWLRTRFFCNVHRELDKGTMYLVDKVFEGETFVTFDSKVLATMLYRVFNNINTWDECIEGWHPFDIDDVHKRVRARRERGDPIWTCAWTVGALPGRYVGQDRLAKVISAIKEWDAPTIVNKLASCVDRRQVFEVIRRQPLMGHFTAFQVTLDLEMILTLEQCDWVYAYDGRLKYKGTINQAGSASGINIVGATAIELRDSQHDDLSALGLRWSDVAWSGRGSLNVVDIEHCLCEFVKYWRFVTGVKTYSRRFNGS